ncbi:MAG TPA: hypothetical protein DF712_10780 [Balneola sp.]|nr:hypothetical protein [Bacteroidota bacterium]HCI70183.1 hypothetical protein [Balneola sp.]HCT52935.1 hypothetical protein [Balneola sp.]|tara:strand:+ start:13034 stop:13522 length:489 start_codon:yes stop_codon:yes gene_type:complete
MKMKACVFSAIIVFSLLSACDKPKNPVYVGEEIKLDFRGIRNIEDLAWIKIDGVKYTHHTNFEKQKDSLSLPASRTTYYLVGNEENETIEKYEPVNPYTVALTLGDKVDMMSIITEQQTARIIREKRFLLHLQATLILHNHNGGDIVVETSKDYPVPIEILK